MRDWLLNIRKAKNMTHDDVATKCSITRQFYSMIENGNRRPSVEIAKLIAKALDFEWTRFYNNEGSDENICSESDSDESHKRVAI